LATFAAKFFMSYSPSLPKGTRDQLPQAMLNREYILGILKDSFKKYGFQAIETPAMEKLETLTGKYGEEGDRLIFKILPRGEKLTKPWLPA
jgi:histidyl-tRNA synthetase